MAFAAAALCLQVQYSQRNLPSNSQRKYVQTVHIPKDFAGDYELTPSFPMELRDVQMLSVSPSGTHLLDWRPSTQTTSTKSLPPLHTQMQLEA